MRKQYEVQMEPSGTYCVIKNGVDETLIVGGLSLSQAEDIAEALQQAFVDGAWLMAQD